MKHLKKIALFIGVWLLVVSCSEDLVNPIEQQTGPSLNIEGEIEVGTHEWETDALPTRIPSFARTSGFTESFTGTKTSYSAGNVNLSSGSWNMTDALLGKLSNDRKSGSTSVRIRNGGYVLMNFDMDNGAATVKLSHGKYGSDGNSTWRLISSRDGGSSWQYAGNTITTSSTSLRTVTFTVNASSRIRFGVYKTSGGSNRINIDNFTVTTGSTSSPASRDSNLTFGNPSDAGSSSNNYRVSKSEYTYSYDNSRGRIKWVSWHLSTAWLGSVGRSDDFRLDPSLPSSFFRADQNSYRGTGFDRGHICPSADRTYSRSANSNTFFMSNMGPQSPNNNRRTWANMENYLRDLARDGNELHIIAGVAGRGGTGSNGFANTIAGGNIDVPSSFWKVILVQPNGTNDVSRVTTSTRVIAVNMPNNQTLSSNWGTYRTSVNSIESLTGLNLLENISNSIENTLESRVDNGPTN